VATPSEAGEEVPDGLTEAETSERIDELEAGTGRTPGGAGVDEQAEQSFPASDPPAHSGTT
jgi:hypothetical protein